MTIKELVSRLQKLDPNADVYVPCPHCCRSPCIDLLTANDVRANHSFSVSQSVWAIHYELAGQHERRYVYLGSAGGECLQDDHGDASVHSFLDLKGTAEKTNEE